MWKRVKPVDFPSFCTSWRSLGIPLDEISCVYQIQNLTANSITWIRLLELIPLWFLPKTCFWYQIDQIVLVNDVRQLIDRDSHEILSRYLNTRIFNELFLINQSFYHEYPGQSKRLTLRWRLRQFTIQKRMFSLVFQPYWGVLTRSVIRRLRETVRAS